MYRVAHIAGQNKGNVCRRLEILVFSFCLISQLINFSSNIITWKVSMRKSQSDMNNFRYSFLLLKCATEVFFLEWKKPANTREVPRAASRMTILRAFAGSFQWQCDTSIMPMKLFAKGNLARMFSSCEISSILLNGMFTKHRFCNGNQNMSLSPHYLYLGSSLLWAHLDTNIAALWGKV